MTASLIPGYQLGDAALPRARVTREDLSHLEQSLLFGDDDRAALRDARRIVAPHVEELLDVWYGFVGAHDFLLASFTTPSGPDSEYLARVRARFSQWVVDTLDANFEEPWLAYQLEIGRRHSVTKNATDGVIGAPAFVPFRYMATLIYPIYATMRPFLDRGDLSAEQVERAHQAWLKAVILSVALWSEPYIKDGWF